ncbi:MAG TPA: aldo/keto reductase [Dongiaceae bacterium]|nr:aldo/keto reductase [Dongiaceae bacterium]
MEKRQLGQSALRVAPLCLGGNVFGWTADEATSHKLLDGFVAGGFNFIDTADVYSRWADGHQGGESEKVIGTWLKKRGKRDDVVIATKVGKDMGGDKKGLRKDYVERAVDASLKRLQTDYIDLYQSHEDDLTLPVEEPLETFGALIKAGKVRAIGASNFGGARLDAALMAAQKNGLPRYESLQPHYNLVERKEFESDLSPVCRKHKLGVIPYFALASGFLTGKYRSEQDFAKSVRGEDAQQYLNPRGRAVLAALDEVASRHNATPAQVALAWLMTRVTAPIASATSIAQLNDIMKSATLKLSDGDLGALDKASA